MGPGQPRNAWRKHLHEQIKGLTETPTPRAANEKFESEDNPASLRRAIRKLIDAGRVNTAIKSV